MVEVEGDDVLGSEGRDRIGRAWHLAWGITSRGDLAIADLPRRPWLEAPPGPEVASAEEWAGAFGGTAPDGADAYRLSAEQLLYVSRASGAVGGDLAAALRRLAGPVQGTATRIRPTRTWDDLVLDAERRERVEEIAIRCRQRRRVFDTWGLAPQPSTGVVALFAGPSGTGKTLAAEVIAADLGVEVYKVDLANMVSKYIGETEKNLSAVFDAAEASSVALFFDEADALLGRRSEVSDAHDRYANIEVAYLLQRLERYDGLAIMATNLLRNIDPAFLRRIHVIVEFPVPEAPERRRILAPVPAAERAPRRRPRPRCASQPGRDGGRSHPQFGGDGGVPRRRGGPADRAGPRHHRRAARDAEARSALRCRHDPDHPVGGGVLSHITD